MRWQGRGSVSGEMDCGRRQIGLVITGGPLLCVSRRADVQLAGAAILRVNMSGVNLDGQRSAGVSRRSLAHQLSGSGARREGGGVSANLGCAWVEWHDSTSARKRSWPHLR